MNILRILPYLDFGGVERVVANSVPFLIKTSKIKVMIIVLGNGGRVEKELLRKGVSVVLFNQNPKIPNFKIILKIFKTIKSFKPDIVHCQAAEANFHGLIAARLAGVPVRIGEEIGFPNHHSYWKWIFKVVYKNATTVIAISQAVKERILELGEVQADKIKVLYNPVEIIKKKKEEEDYSVAHDHEINKNLHIKTSSQNQKNRENRFVFVTTCRLVPVKNLDRLIYAFSSVCRESLNNGFELWIVGDGPLRITLESRSKELGIADRVRFWGFKENVFPFLGNSDVFVLPSLSEGSSVALVEAMKLGLPSIATEVGGTSEIIGNSQSGVLINPYDTDSIKNALLYFINLNKSELLEMGNRALIESRRFSTEIYLKSLLEIYQK